MAIRWVKLPGAGYRPYLIAFLFLMTTATAWAQDSQPIAEPHFPSVCVSPIPATLTIDQNGPVVPGGSAADEGQESLNEASAIQKAVAACAKAGGGAVELARGSGPGQVAFLINPIVLLPTVSLIIDGGVTVYASRDPAKYPLDSKNYPNVVCGTVGQNYPVTGCASLITLTANSGVYGFGVIDGQGQRVMIKDNTFTTRVWWSLLDTKKTGCDGSSSTSDNGCQQAAPIMISAGNFDGHISEATNLTLYKITVRNPPFHTIRIGAKGGTIWGVGVQAPWNIPNSDGFDANGQDLALINDTVANGDQDIAIGQGTKNVTIGNFTAYGKGGVALIGSVGASNILVNGMAMTGDLPSFIPAPGPVNEPFILINGVNPMTYALPWGDYLASYGQALPTATNEVQGLQIDPTPPAPRENAAVYNNINFQNVCLQDVVWPIHIAVDGSYSKNVPPPQVTGVAFENVHVLPPTYQFPAMTNGIVQGERGTYSADFISVPFNKDRNQITFNNVVFDDASPGVTSLGNLTAKYNQLTTTTNVYPPQLNQWNRKITGWTLKNNSYADRTSKFDQSMAQSCPSSLWPFVRGDLYVSQTMNATGAENNLQGSVTATGSTFVLNAVVQPAMSQTTYFRYASYNANPGLLALASPPLTGNVLFFASSGSPPPMMPDASTAIGNAALSANGTLASFTAQSPTQTTVYSAWYPGNVIYPALLLGAVSVSP